MTDTKSRIRLSPNFLLHEFTRSETAARMGRVIEVDDVILEDLRRLCLEVMEPVRTHLGGRAITITSGYRPLWLNQRIGGSIKSEHMYGRACDFIVQGFTTTQVCRAIQTILHQLPVNQLIHEFGEWTHISICDRTEQPIRKLLTAEHVDGRLRYSAGIPA